jgi:hypothetical protein
MDHQFKEAQHWRRMQAGGRIDRPSAPLRNGWQIDDSCTLAATCRGFGSSARAIVDGTGGRDLGISPAKTAFGTLEAKKKSCRLVYCGHSEVGVYALSQEKWCYSVGDSDSEFCNQSSVQGHSLHCDRHQFQYLQGIHILLKVAVVRRRDRVDHSVAC